MTEHVGTDHVGQGHEPRGSEPRGSEPRGSEPRGSEPRGREAHRRDARDTRARIQRVALELFAEQGYEATSLREIAERLDVTKAALYYHFKSKDDIVTSLVEDYFGQLDELVTWADTQPRTPQTRAAILGRYVRIVADGHEVFRMLHQNQAAVNSLASAKPRGDVFRERMSRLVDVIAGPDAGMQERLSATMILGGASIGWMFFANEVDDRDKLIAAVLDCIAEFTSSWPDNSQGPR